MNDYFKNLIYNIKPNTDSISDTIRSLEHRDIHPNYVSFEVWGEISKLHSTLSMEFIQEYISFFHIQYLTDNIEIVDMYLKQMHNLKFIWNSVSMYFTEEIIENSKYVKYHLDDLNWCNISANMSFSTNFLYKYEKYLTQYPMQLYIRGLIEFVCVITKIS